MIILIIAIFLFLLGLYLISISDWRSNYEIAGLTLTVIGGFAILFLLLGIISANFGVDKRIARYNQFKQTIEEARKNPDAIYERAALTKEIIDYNRYLTNEKYDNRYWYWWDYWTSDKIANLPYIK